MTKRALIGSYLALLAIAILLAAIPLSLTRTPPLYSIARGAGLVGYLFVFLAVLSSALVRPLVRRYRKPFLTLHHWVAGTGLVLLMVHPLILAYLDGSFAVFFAAYRGGGNFWRYAGSPALVTLILAAIAATARARRTDYWRYIHWLTYVALFLGTTHAVLIGTSVAGAPWLRWVFFLSAAAGAAVYIIRRSKPSPAPRSSRSGQ